MSGGSQDSGTCTLCYNMSGGSEDTVRTNSPQGFESQFVHKTPGHAHCVRTCQVVHKTPGHAHCVTTCQVVQKIPSGQIVPKDLNPRHCDLDLEDSNPKLLHNTPAHDDAPLDQVWF